MKKIYSTLLFACLAFAGTAQTVNLNPAKDNSIYSENTNSSGAGQLYTGRTCGSSNRRTLMQFDLSSIPVGATIVSASLTVNVNNVSAGAGTNTYNAYALTTGFGEGTSFGGGSGSTAIAPDATWIDAMLGTAAWTTAGGDFVPVSLSNVAMGTSTGNQTFPTSINFVSAVQSWYDTPASNFGVILIGDETTTCTARRFGSKEIGTAPILTVTYTAPACSTQPTPICQNITAYLDGAGNATIAAGDLDGGSIDNCATSGLTFNASQTAFDCSDISVGAGGSNLLITGAYDGPLPGGLPKGVELYASGNIADLSNYGIGSANNGGGTDGEEFTFPADVVSAGTFIYVTSDSAGFNDFFGFNADYITSSMLINGDDAVELFQSAAVVDVFGDINTDGTGEAWDFVNGWAYRNDFETPNAGVFDTLNWYYSGVNQLELGLTNLTCVSPFPIATFIPSSSGVSVDLYVTDGNFNVDTCTAFVNVLDTLAAIPDSSTLSNILDPCQVTTLPTPSASDNCSGSITGTHDAILPITASGTTVVTWTYTDGSGNTVTQLQNVIISDLIPPVPDDTMGLLNITAECSVSLPVAPTATDNCSGPLNGTPDVTFPVTSQGTTLITWTFTDGAGNTSTQTQNIVITDVTDPVVDVATLADLSDGCEVTPTAPTATDNCDGALTGTPDVTFPISAMGNTTITWTYTDGVGNTATQTQLVTINGLDVSTSETGGTITAASTGVTYQWIDCLDDSFVAGETGQTFTPTVTGDYAVIITDAPCTDTSACTNIVVDGLFENTIDLGISIQPNPSSGKFKVTFNEVIDAEVTIYDAQGKLVLSATINGESSIQLDLTSFKSGVYIMKTLTNQGVSNARLLKQ